MRMVLSTYMLINEQHKNYGAPEGIRTPDLWYRKPTLYPTELQTRNLY
jgi:hypothetical protein